MRRVGEARLFGLDGPLVAAGTEAGADPNDHEGVLPRDFSGSWRVDADGRWRGTFDLVADEQGNVSGTYLSDESQSSYPLIGKIDVGSNRAVIEVELVNSAQLFEAFLWSSDKSVMAGSTTLADRKFGFYAVRADESGAAAPSGDPEAGPQQP
jgi:hypothetical protein